MKSLLRGKGLAWLTWRSASWHSQESDHHFVLRGKCGAEGFVGRLNRSRLYSTIKSSPTPHCLPYLLCKWFQLGNIHLKKSRLVASQNTIERMPAPHSTPFKPTSQPCTTVSPYGEIKQNPMQRPFVHRAGLAQVRVQPLAAGWIFALTSLSWSLARAW